MQKKQSRVLVFLLLWIVAMIAVPLVKAEAAGTLRFGQLSADEYFVSEKAARDGLLVTNASRFEPLVMLKHFGPNNREVPDKGRQEDR